MTFSKPWKNAPEIFQGLETCVAKAMQVKN